MTVVTLQLDTPPAPPSAETQKNLRFNMPDTCRQKEESVMAVSIQPSGSYSRTPRTSASPRYGVEIVIA